MLKKALQVVVLTIQGLHESAYGVVVSQSKDRQSVADRRARILKLPATVMQRGRRDVCDEQWVDVG